MKLSSALLLASGIAFLLSLAPLLGAAAVPLVASLVGCELQGSGPVPCTIAGLEVGSGLYNATIGVWLLLFSWFYIPVAIVLLVVGLFIGRSRRTIAEGQRNVGVVFWLLYFSAMTLPFTPGLAVLLLALAMLIQGARHYRLKGRSE
jgi:hypothetical protein